MKFEICLSDSAGVGVEFTEAAATPAAACHDRPRMPPRRHVTATSGPVAGALPSCEIPGVSKAILTIRHEYSRQLTVPVLARECGMSERTLHRRYRSVTGNTIGQDLVARRIEVAAGLLREEDAKLEPVAIETGLGSAKNLCRLFKEHLGLTPGQWKQSFQRRTEESA
jgi:transcriptional regulator GlxA family with amidase domain